jgi:hypothetical protein
MWVVKNWNLQKVNLKRQKLSDPREYLQDSLFSSTGLYMILRNGNLKLSLFFRGCCAAVLSQIGHEIYFHFNQ